MTDTTPPQPPFTTTKFTTHNPSDETANKPAPLDYRPMIADEVDAGDLTQDQADDFLKALFTIMERFVLDGHDFGPVDKLISGFEKAALSASSVVNSEKSNTHETYGER